MPMDWTKHYQKLAPAEAGSNPKSPEEAVRTLTAGNERFVAQRRLSDKSRQKSGGDTAPEDNDALINSKLKGIRSFADELAPVGEITPQSPFAVIFSCADARVPAEIVFDTGPNRLFVVRVAGSVPGAECVGSIEYAVKSFQDMLQIVAVIGHTGCGAVSAAAGSYLNPKGYGAVGVTQGLRAIVNHVMVAVRSAALSLEQEWGEKIAEDPGFKDALVETAVYLNAAITAHQLSKELDDKAPPVVFGVYDLATSKVGLPDDEEGYAIKLSPAPSNPEQLVELGRTIARSEAIRNRLKTVNGSA